MGNSFIERDDNGFWIHDSTLGITCSCIYLTISKSNYKDDWLIEMAELIKMNSYGHFIGWMHFSFEEYLTDEPRNKIFITLLDETAKWLESKGEILDMKDLDEALDEEWKKHYAGYTTDTARIIKVISLLKKVVMGEKVDDSPKSESWFL